MGFRSTNSAGNDTRGVMRFLREVGIKPTVANVERMGRELRRSQTENEKVEARHREIEATKGVPSTRDEKGDVHARVRRQVQRDIEKRSRRR